MKAIGIVIAVAVAAVGLLVAFTRLGAPAVLLLAGGAAVAWWLRRALRKDPYAGWGNARALGVMVLLASGVWSLISLLAGQWLIAVPNGLIAVIASVFIAHCNKKLAAAIPHQGVGMAQHNDEAANAFVSQTITENRRSHARGQSLHLQTENLELLRKNQALEQEVIRLRAEVQRLDGALHDPFYDPT